MAKVDLLSPLTREECVDRLRAGLLNPSSDVDGRVEYEWVRLSKKIFYRNSFKTFLCARLVPEGTGTRVRGSLGLHPYLKWFAGFGFAFIGFLCALAVANGMWFPQLLVPLGGLVGGVVGLWVGRRLCRGQDRLLMEFVTSAVNAEPVAVK